MTIEDPAFYLKNLNKQNYKTVKQRLRKLVHDKQFELMIENKIRKFEKHKYKGYGVGPLIYIWKKLQMYQTGDWGYTPHSGKKIIDRLFVRKFNDFDYQIFVHWLKHRSYK